MRRTFLPDGFPLTGNDVKDLFYTCSSCHGIGKSEATFFRSDDFDLPSVGIRAKKDSLIPTLEGLHGSSITINDLPKILTKLKLWKLNEFKK
jgi:hypothetical protein